MSEKREAELLLIAITVVWGLTFSLVKKSLAEIQPFVFMAWRFWLAFIVTGLLCLKKLRVIDRGMLKAGL
ncbi:MAG: EamA family transporter, partial [Actinobacteria bacterium]|nr:EamA family transporter [Actinomycetota bacterium]